MATAPKPATPRKREVDYPTSDGRPLGETERHRQVILDLITTLQARFADQPDVYVGGDLLLFYEEGNRRKHIAPDVFVVRGVPKLPMRDYYLLWKEGKSPDLVIEITSKTTRREDQTKKLVLYRDLIKVPEYFQFDPTEDYLRPSMQGHRLVDGRYVPIAPVDGRLPSEFLGLHLERVGPELRLYDPADGQVLLTEREDLQVERIARRADREALQVERIARRADREALQVERNARRADREALRIAQQREAEAQQREAEAQQREAEAQQHKAEAQQREAEAQQREAEAQQREAEAQQHKAEAQQRADAVEAENQRLLRELEAFRRRPAPPDA